MSEICLVKTDTGKLVGLTPSDEAMRRKTKARLDNMEPGEMVRASYVVPRNYKFLQKIMVLFTVGFDHWTPDRKRFSYKGQPIAKDFNNFRKSITIQAGFFKQVFDINGRMELEAESLSYDQMDHERFEQCYDAVAQVLLERVLTNYKRDDLDRVVNELLSFTERRQ